MLLHESGLCRHKTQSPYLPHPPPGGKLPGEAEKKKKVIRLLKFLYSLNGAYAPKVVVHCAKPIGFMLTTHYQMNNYLFFLDFSKIPIPQKFYSV